MQCSPCPPFPCGQVLVFIQSQHCLSCRQFCPFHLLLFLPTLDLCMPSGPHSPQGSIQTQLQQLPKSLQCSPSARCPGKGSHPPAPDTPSRTASLKGAAEPQHCPSQKVTKECSRIRRGVERSNQDHLRGAMNQEKYDECV